MGAAALLIASGASAHNLNQRADYLAFDKATLDMMQARALAGQPLLQAGDTVGLVLKATPTIGTQTGAGGYSTFFLPTGTQVIGADYGHIGADGSFVPTPMKGQSILSLGEGSIGGKATPNLTGLSLGPNVTGQTSQAVDGAGIALGTMAGVYGDTGIFYSTDPKTAWQSWANGGGLDGNVATTTDNVVTNNSGDVVIPTTRWDAEQLIAFGITSPIKPLVDAADGRGNTPWGMGSGVAGPESGYAWAFDKTYWDANPANPSRMKNSVSSMGPWKRIRYPGSLVAKDTPGLHSTALGFAAIDASNIGFDLSPANPLPTTTSWADSTSPKAVRVSWGSLVLYQSEFARIKLKINVGPGQPNGPFDPTGFLQGYGDTFGGDAGGEYGNKDHLWRYYEPTTVQLTGKPFVYKQVSKSLVAPGETYSYTIYVMNFGNTALTNVVVEDTLPSGVQFISAVPAQSTGPNPLRWNLGGVLPGSIRNITVNVVATGTGVLTNTVCSWSDQSPVTCSTDSTSVQYKPLLYPDKTVTPTTAVPGGTVTYTLTISNEGTGGSSSPMPITEYLPAGFTYGSLVSVKLNGAVAPSGALTVDASNLSRPVFTLGQSILPTKKLEIVFTTNIGVTVPAWQYCNSYSFVESGSVIATGALACVTVGGGRIGDTVFRDWDGDGVMDADDEGLAGVTVQLFASNGTTLLGTKITDAQGRYDFISVSGGTYVVKVTPPAAHTATYDLDGIASLNQTTVTIAEGEGKLNVDFGYRPGGTGSVSGTVFFDVDRDGTYETSNDTGLASVTVRLYRDVDGDGVIDAGMDALLATQDSDVSGNFSFPNLSLALDYIVDVDQNDADIPAGLGGSPYSITWPFTTTSRSLSGGGMVS